jgi:hypothetical protein
MALIAQLRPQDSHVSWGIDTDFDRAFAGSDHFDNNVVANLDHFRLFASKNQHLGFPSDC